MDLLKKARANRIKALELLAARQNNLFADSGRAHRPCRPHPVMLTNVQIAA